MKTNTTKHPLTALPMWQVPVTIAGRTQWFTVRAATKAQAVALAKAAASK